jgi:hypothetical protein
MLALALKEEEAGEVREIRRSSLFCSGNGNGNSWGDGRPAARRRDEGGWGWREDAWARRHVRASRRIQAERDDAGFGVAAAERNNPDAFGVPRCSVQNAKGDLQVALPGRYRPQCEPVLDVDDTRYSRTRNFISF